MRNISGSCNFESAMKHLKIIILTCLSAALFRCTNSAYTPGRDDVCFTRDVQPVIDAGCAKSGCHDNTTKAAGIALISYPDIASAEKIAEIITKPQPEGGMPPAPWVRLSDEHITAISAWTDQGRKNTTCDSLPLPDSSSITYTKHIVPIINLYCIGCHLQRGAGGPALTTYEDVRDEIENGNLISTIRRKPGYVPMPAGRTRMTSRDVRIIEMWSGTFQR